eukprot:TRINITY_DN23816_c0_g1_i2.p1 TRINITY_DN23816_c0_g1~~TRINITY_DN23816_c0_g1_i2.p1  ORF type:complete len:336 (+),score=52.30 TRINITY_DN23816_c0_g1_i2:109-1008(+)
MAEGYQAFLDYDWSGEEWQAYLKNLYPEPGPRQLLKFKKKWYKKTVDADFDETYEPPGSASSSASPMYEQDNGAPVVFPPKEASRWRKMGQKAMICAAAHGLAMTGAIAAAAGALPAYQALVVLVLAFILELLAKYGMKFNNTYVQSVLLDDVGVMPMMALTVFTPGLHPWIRTLALVPPFFTSLLSFGQICKEHTRLPGVIRDFFSPLGELSARYKVMKIRAHIQVAPVSVLLFWNFMKMRYMTSPWTQASFTSIDNCLHPVLSRIPGVARLYAASKRFLYSFVDPNSKQSGRFCNIL